MGYIVAVVLIVLIVLIMHFFTELTTKQKTLVGVVFGSFVLFAYLYNTYTAQKEQQMLQAVLHFRQGKTIVCQDGIEVNSTNFNLSIGTYSFIGKRNTPYYSQMVSAWGCK